MTRARRAHHAGPGVGVAAHGICAARAFAVDPLAGTFAGTAMGLNATLSSLLLPVFVRLMFPASSGDEVLI